jgi:TRAP transporter TAXI family solute receptor
MVELVDRYLFKVLAVLTLVFVIAVAASFIASLPPRQFTILTGREGEGNFQAALAYQQIAREKGFELDIQTTAGSAEVLQRLIAGEASVGFVQSGLARDVDPKVLSSVASVYYEPVWIFYRTEAFGDQGLKSLTDLKGKRVAIGAEGSGTHTLALQLLAANGVSAADATLEAIGASEGSAALEAGDLDAAILVTSENSNTVRRLLMAPGIALMDFERAEAYAEVFPHLKAVRLPRGAIDLQRDIPEEDKRLVAATANLVARHDIHPDLLRLLTIAAVETHWDGGLFADPGEFPNDRNVDLPMDRHERAYLARFKTDQSVLDNYLPFRFAAIIDRYWLFILPIVFLFLPLLFRAPMAFRSWNMYKINRWYKEIRRIEFSLDRLDLQQLEQERIKLQQLDDTVTVRTNVGLFYLPSAYDLHWHMGYLLEKIERRKQALMAETPGAASGDAG